MTTTTTTTTELDPHVLPDGIRFYAWRSKLDQAGDVHAIDGWERGRLRDRLARGEWVVVEEFSHNGEPAVFVETASDGTPAERELAYVRRTRSPRRVVTRAGKTVHLAKAPSDTDVVPVVVFIRTDGWSLGARKCDEAAAEALWSRDWVFRLELWSGHATKYAGRR